MKTLEEYIALYERKTGEKFEFKQPFSFAYDPEYGFCEYNVKGDDVYLWQVCGDVWHWVDIARKACVAFDLKTINAYILRHPLPFIRRLGFKVVKIENKNGEKRYTCDSVKFNGDTLIALQMGDRYMFTWKVVNTNV